MLFIVISVAISSCCADIDENDLIAAANSAVDFRSSAAVVERLKVLPPTRVAEFVEATQKSDNEVTREIAAMALNRLPSKELYQKYWRIAATDKSPKVKRIVWLGALLRPSHGKTTETLVDEKMRQAMLSECDPVLTAGIVLTTENPDQLLTLVTNESEFIRAVIARRLAKLKKKDSELPYVSRSIIEVLLVDQSELVRANALIGAHQLGYTPLGTLKGLMLDARRFVAVEALVMGEKSASSLREKYGLPGKYEWSTYMLSLMLSTYAESVPLFERISIPLDQDKTLLIGSVSADVSVESHRREAILFIEAIACKTKLSADLRKQLEAILRNTG